MTEQRVREIARDEMRQQGNKDTYSVAKVPRHVHNGVDAPYAYSPQQVFAGNVPYDIFIGGITFIIPKGWVVRYDGTGIYTLIHNFGTLAYSTVATGTQSTNEVVTPIITYLPNEVTLTWFDASGTFTEVDTSFCFVIVLLVNKSINPPSYNDLTNT